MKGFNVVLLVWVLLMCSYQVCFAQSRQELEKQRLQIIKDIERTSKDLDKTKKNKEKGIEQLKVLETQINSRKKLINNLASEVKVNEKTLVQNNERIASLREKYASLTAQYGSIIRTSYLKKMASSKWIYLLSADNLNNLILRWRYITQFENFTKNKLEEIKLITEEINQKNIEITEVKKKNLEALEVSSKNVDKLAVEQKEKDQLVKKLSKDETNLLGTLKKRQKERENLNAAIEKVILAELAKAKAKEKDDGVAVKRKEIDDNDFAKNKGSLRWPIQKGKIISKFGTHDHPTIRNVQVTNNGVDFSLTSGQDVKCVFDGEIVGVTEIPGFKNMIIIRHGSYYSVYSKLDNVSVSKGDKVKRGQTIGSVTGDGDDGAEMHFELWKDKNKLNPERWFN